MARDDLSFAEPMFEHLFDLLLSRFCTDLLIDASDEDRMIGRKFLNELLLRCELSVAHFVAKAKQKSVGEQGVDQC